jgi:hypothetical protein
MLNLVHMFGATKKEFRGKGGSFAPSETSRVRRRRLVRSGDSSCEVETSRARQRLLVRGGDLLCEADTCRGDPSCGELVGDAANWSKT